MCSMCRRQERLASLKKYSLSSIKQRRWVDSKNSHFTLTRWVSFHLKQYRNNFFCLIYPMNFKMLVFRAEILFKNDPWKNREYHRYLRLFQGLFLEKMSNLKTNILKFIGYIPIPDHFLELLGQRSFLKNREYHGYLRLFQRLFLEQSSRK